MDPLTQNLAQFLTAILTPTRPTALADGTERIRHVCKLDRASSLPVPGPLHLALFDLFPIWGQVKDRIPLFPKRLDDSAEDFLKMGVQGGNLMELGAVAPDTKRYPAGLPGRKPN
jgi:hypothetical protein